MSTSATHNQRVLIAERDHTLGDMLTTVLRLERYDTDVALTLEDALAKVDHSLYNLVVTDLFITRPPIRLDGPQQLQQRCEPTPVGILTAWPVNPDETKRAGFAFVLPKPFDINALLERVAALLNVPFTAEQAQQAHIIRRFLDALSKSEWEELRTLCAPDVGYYPLTGSVFTKLREIKGINACLVFAQQVRSRLPDFAIEQAVVFQHESDLITRYRAGWRGPDGQRQGITGSVVCRFRGERIFQIGLAQNSQRMQALLEAPQE